VGESEQIVTCRQKRDLAQAFPLLSDGSVVRVTVSFRLKETHVAANALPRSGSRRSAVAQGVLALLCCYACILFQRRLQLG
jgi:hypothetical protein